MSRLNRTELRDTSFKNQWTRRLQAISNFPVVLRALWRSSPPIVVSSIVLRAITFLIPLGMLATSRFIIDGVVSVSQGHPRPALFWWWVGAEFGLATLSSVLGRTISFLDGLMADRFSGHLSLRIMNHAARLDLASFEEPAFYDRLERARSQSSDRLQMIRSIGDVIQQAGTSLVLCASVFVYSPWLLVLLGGCILPAFAVESYFAFLAYSLSHQQTSLRREIDYLQMLAVSRDSVKELKLFGLAKYLSDRFHALWTRAYKQTSRLSRRRLMAGSLLSAVASGGYYAAYAWVAWRALRGEITVGTMTFLVGSIAGASSNLQSLFAKFAGIADEALFLTDLVAFFKEQPEIQNSGRRLPFPEPIQQGFQFENVTFQYPGSESKILNGINLNITPGERLALVGQNGQGKTTLVKLLARLYDPTEGRILLDGVDLRDYDSESLSRQIAVIFQDFMRYDMTVRHNIGMGQVEYLEDARNADRRQDAIAKAAELSKADEVIARLPLQLEQMLGRRFEGGVDLSGGEWQKIALARAYLRNAQVLILDEPTAALDAQSEMEFFQGLSDLSEGRMALLISHRFSTVRMADRILVLSDGRIIEQGTHRELLDISGRYAEMFAMQAASYQN